MDRRPQILALFAAALLAAASGCVHENHAAALDDLLAADRAFAAG